MIFHLGLVACIRLCECLKERIKMEATYECIEFLRKNYNGTNEIIWNEKFNDLHNYPRHFFTDTYNHSIRVAVGAAILAKMMGANIESAIRVGLLHDIDFEQYPEEHCKKAPELLKEIKASEEMIHAICSHGYGICSTIKPEHEMEKILFAVDELTGLIWAAAKMRPSKSTKDMEVSSLKKKFKDKKFAAGCSRDIISQGAELLGWELDDLFDKTIQAMRSCEADVAAAMEN